MPRDPSAADHSPKILVVEDEALIALEALGHLEEWGYRIAGTAGTAKAALDIALSQGPDLALVDINLRHGDDGISVARMLKDKFGAGIVFVTGFSDETTKRRMATVGPIACLFKPYEPRSLREILSAAAA